MKRMPKFVYLASQSPRRGQLLEQLGVAYELLLPDDSEDAEALEVVLPNEAPRAYVQRVTQLKLDAALARMKSAKYPPRLCCVQTPPWLWAKPFWASPKATKTHNACCAP